MESLVKFLARAGSFPRRQAEALIREGRIRVNEAPALSPSLQVGPRDRVLLDGRPLSAENIKVYIALNKPDGYMSDLRDVRGRKLARDLIKHDLRLFPVGRLDYHSEGLMIFTNDGDLANEVMHPRYNVTKEYLVKFKGLLTAEAVTRMKKGMLIEGELYQAEAVRLVRKAPANVWYSIIVNEGKNRMIRKMGAALGHPVLRLRRIRIGKLHLGDLNPGEYRHIEKNEII
ncbi:MAG: Ribosomal large subunit pseudouridine synthase B [Syntrophorhabdus sp. PtaB.Bin047]|nr:MAG: Ribosomal large subunit pseudouridine synthase B [Syntrophorhabdus sp. PtaB.Bin047]